MKTLLLVGGAIIALFILAGGIELHQTIQELLNEVEVATQIARVAVDTCEDSK